MKTLYLDLFSGISGDMFIAALIDLGVEASQLEQELKKLRLAGYHLHVARGHKASLEGVKFDVHLSSDHDHGEESPGHRQTHSHSHAHPHEHGRTFAQIRQLIAESPTATEDAIAWKLIEEMGLRGAEMLLPVFERERRFKGRLSMQTNPVNYMDFSKLVEQAVHFDSLAPNIQVKFPCTAAGLVGIEEILGPIDGVGFVRLGESDVVRNRIVRAIVSAYERHGDAEPAR